MTKRGQSIMEYVLIITLVVLGIIYGGPYVLRSVNAYFHLWDTGAQESLEENLWQAPPNAVPNMTSNCVQITTPSRCGGNCPEGEMEYTHTQTGDCFGTPPTSPLDCRPDCSCSVPLPSGNCGQRSLFPNYCTGNVCTPPPNTNASSVRDCYVGQEFYNENPANAGTCPNVSAYCQRTTSCMPRCDTSTLPSNAQPCTPTQSNLSNNVSTWTLAPDGTNCTNPISNIPRDTCWYTCRPPSIPIGTGPGASCGNLYEVAPIWYPGCQAGAASGGSANPRAVTYANSNCRPFPNPYHYPLYPTEPDPLAPNGQIRVGRGLPGQPNCYGHINYECFHWPSRSYFGNNDQPYFDNGVVFNWAPYNNDLTPDRIPNLMCQGVLGQRENDNSWFSPGVIDSSVDCSTGDWTSGPGYTSRGNQYANNDSFLDVFYTGGVGGPYKYNPLIYNVCREFDGGSGSAPTHCNNYNSTLNPSTPPGFRRRNPDLTIVNTQFFGTNWYSSMCPPPRSIAPVRSPGAPANYFVTDIPIQRAACFWAGSDFSPSPTRYGPPNCNWGNNTQTPTCTGGSSNQQNTAFSSVRSIRYFDTCTNGDPGQSSRCITAGFCANPAPGNGACNDNCGNPGTPGSYCVVVVS